MATKAQLLESNQTHEALAKAIAALVELYTKYPVLMGEPSFVTLMDEHFPIFAQHVRLATDMTSVTLKHYEETKDMTREQKGVFHMNKAYALLPELRDMPSKYKQYHN